MADTARLDELRQQFQLHPRRSFAPLASALRRAGDARGAVALARAQLARFPGHLTGHVILGQALLDVGDRDEARAAFERAHGLDEGNVVALGALVEVTRALGDGAAAARWVALLREADPEHPAATAFAVDAFEPLALDEFPADAVAMHDAPFSSDALDPRLAVDSAPVPGAGQLPEPVHEAETAQAPEAAHAPALDEVAEAAQAPEPVVVAEPAPAPAAELPPLDPVVGLDVPPDDPLPASMREALPELFDEEPPRATESTPDVPEDAAAPPAAVYVTETMAGVLLAQGHTAQALDVYAQLLAQRPYDEGLRARVASLRGESQGAERDVVTEADERAADMWRAAFAPLPAEPEAVTPASAPPTVAAAPAATVPAAAAPADATPASDTPFAAPQPTAPAADPVLDDLSFDRFFEPFGAPPEPAVEPVGDFERWVAGVGQAGAPAAGSSPSAAPSASFADAAPPDVEAAVATAEPVDDPEADLAAFNAWLHGRAA